MKNISTLNQINKTWTILSILITILFASNTLNAQKEYIERGQSYNGKMYLKSSQFVAGNKIELINDTTIKYYTSSGQEKFVSTNDVHWVSIKTGSHAGTGALLGGLTGVLTALLVQMNYELDPYATPVNFAPLYLGCGAGGLLIGALIGSASSITKSLYMPSYNLSSNLRFGPSLKYAYPSIHLVYKL